MKVKKGVMPIDQRLNVIFDLFLQPFLHYPKKGPKMILKSLKSATKGCVRVFEGCFVQKNKRENAPMNPLLNLTSTFDLRNPGTSEGEDADPYFARKTGNASTSLLGNLGKNVRSTESTLNVQGSPNPCTGI